jgi:hypothetical protein
VNWTRQVYCHLVDNVPGLEKHLKRGYVHPILGSSPICVRISNLERKLGVGDGGATEGVPGTDAHPRSKLKTPSLGALVTWSWCILV